MTDNYQEWIGKTETSQDELTRAPLLGMAATLDRQGLAFNPGDVLPPLWHWLYFLNPTPQSGLGEDGHARKGDFLPPISLPRRMWAGSRFEFQQPLRAGQKVSRHSTIRSIDFKQGRSGQLAFVCVGHEIYSEDGCALREEHDIVYREPPPVGAAPPQPQPAPERYDYCRIIQPDPVLLFRYSALTFNGHRIHYDRDYVTQVEGYAGLIVHGPLLATLLIELLGEHYPDRQVQQFQFQARHPVFDINPFQVCGLHPDAENRVRLWIQDHNASLCMEATALVNEAG